MCQAFGCRVISVPQTKYFRPKIIATEATVETKATTALPPKLVGKHR